MLARRLCYLGFAILAATVWLNIADLKRWVPEGAADAWTWTLVRAGGVCLGAGAALLLFSPLARELRRGHCVRCGRSTERGQVYCLDHIQQTLDEYRDDTRERLLSHKRTRA